MLTRLLAVGAGGFLGAVARYLVGLGLHRLPGAAHFPYGTLAANVLGCLAIGYAGGLVEAREVLGPQARLFLIVGVLGGFTTFSTFGFESLQLARGDEPGLGLVNVLLHLGLGLSAVWIGFALSPAVAR